MATDIRSLPPLTPQPEFSGILRNEERFGATDNDSTSDQVNTWFDDLMIQAGLEISPTVVLLLTMLGALTVGGIAFVLRENLLITALAACVGFVLPIAIIAIARGRRQKLMMDQLPMMVDELARAAKTGRSLEKCIQQIAFDTPAPLGSEIQRCSRRMQMGVDLRAALSELPHRTGLMSLSILVTALSVHQQTGGDLVNVLERLAHTIRDRLMFLGRFRAATTASRATAMLMIILPPLVVGFFGLRDDQYINDLLSTAWGRGAAILAIVLQIIGSLWVLRILRTSQKA